MYDLGILRKKVDDLRLFGDIIGQSDLLRLYEDLSNLARGSHKGTIKNLVWTDCGTSENLALQTKYEADFQEINSIINLSLIHI
jgi:hypothetical protein